MALPRAVRKALRQTEPNRHLRGLLLLTAIVVINVLTYGAVHLVHVHAVHPPRVSSGAGAELGSPLLTRAPTQANLLRSELRSEDLSSAVLSMAAG